jgi:1-deoxy-D-xylulose-5-phosphate synthase
MIRFSESFPHPLAIRYPRSGKVLFQGDCAPVSLGKWEYLHKAKNSQATVFATGERNLIIAMEVLKKLQERGKDFSIVNARFIKPLDLDLIKDISDKYFVTLEDNVFLGGFGSAFNNACHSLNKNVTIRNFAYIDQFIPHGKVGDLQKEYGVNGEDLEKYLSEVIV